MSEVISKRLNPKHWFFREGIHQLLNLILWAQHPQRASLTVCKTILLHNLSSWNQFIEQSQLGGKWLSCFLQPLPSNIFISWPSFQADPVASRFLQVYEGIPLHSWQLPCRDWRGLVQAKSHETSSPIPGLSPNTLNRAATWWERLACPSPFLLILPLLLLAFPRSGLRKIKWKEKHIFFVCLNSSAF